MSAQDRKPNVLFFFTDDQRFDTLHALGNEHIITPNLDALVRRGTFFRNAHIMGGTSGAVCMPSRAMLMTGRTLFRIKGQGQNIADDHTIMPEHFRAQGYRTFGTGKWHNGPKAYHRAFTDGANIFFGGMSDHFAVPLNHFDPTGEYPQDKIYHEDKRHSSDLFSGAAIDFLKKRQGDDNPFFAYISFTAPHDPRDTHPKYHAMYDPDTIPVPENFMPEHPFDNGELVIRDEMLAPMPRTPEVVRQHIAEYYAMITHIDDRIGDVLKALEETGEADNTIIVFAGDNGLALGRHGLMGKQNLYDHSVRVPFLLSGPGIPESQVSDTFCYLLDIYPTLCELTGLDIPASVEGRSLTAAIADPAACVRDVVHLAYREIMRGVRDERYKLIEYVTPTGRRTQLFDLQEDPFEMNDLSASEEHASEITRLREELVKWRDEMGDQGAETIALGSNEKFWDKVEI